MMEGQRLPPCFEIQRLGKAFHCYEYVENVHPNFSHLKTVPIQKPLLLRLAHPASLTQLYTINHVFLFICRLQLTSWSQKDAVTPLLCSPQ